jgi:hypothetical protein
MVFLEFLLGTNNYDLKKDFRLFLDENHSLDSLQLQINGDMLVGTSPNEEITSMQLNACVKSANAVLKDFKKTIKGKYSRKVINDLKFNINLYSPVKKSNFFKIKGKTALSILSVIEKFSFEYRRHEERHKCVIIIKTEYETERFFEELKKFIFSNCIKTAGINVEKDVERM